jgi:hypothetical protein
MYLSKLKMKLRMRKLIDKQELYNFYAQVSYDIQNGNQDMGVWAKAFADADGNESKAKAIYIDLMVERLILAKNAKNAILDNKVKVNNHQNRTRPNSTPRIEYHQSSKNTDNPSSKPMPKIVKAILYLTYFIAFIPSTLFFSIFFPNLLEPFDIGSFAFVTFGAVIIVGLFGGFLSVIFNWDIDA